jgi:hypothetical protein
MCEAPLVRISRAEAIGRKEIGPYEAWARKKWGIMRTGAGFTGYEGEAPASGIPSTPLRKGTIPIIWSAATRLIESFSGGSCECIPCICVTNIRFTLRG